MPKVVCKKRQKRTDGSLLPSILRDYIELLLKFLDHQGTVRAAKAEGVRQEDVDVLLLGLGHDIQILRIFIRVFEIDVRRDEGVFHHQAGVNNLAGASHPALVSRHGLRGADGGMVFGEEVVESQGLERVALFGGGSVGVDVVDILGSHVSILEGAFHSDSGAHIGRL